VSSELQQREARFAWRDCIAILIGLAVVAGICAALGHYSCHHVEANVASPEAGTPRANYCSAADAGAGWLMFTVPLVVGVAGFAAVRRRRRAVQVVALAVAVAALANMLLILLLSPAYTI
jgi:MYXO-CTERM domain-containing protein